MDKLKELQLEREKLRERLREIRKEELDLEFKGLDLFGKYLYNETRGLYIKVDNFWMNPPEEDRILYLVGETLCFSSSEESDLCYFNWSLLKIISESFQKGYAGFKENWKEITEEEWKEIKSEAWRTLRDMY